MWIVKTNPKPLFLNQNILKNVDTEIAQSLGNLQACCKTDIYKKMS